MVARSARADVRDLEFREGLSVSLLPQVMRAALELDDRYLGALAVAHHRGEHLATLQGGLADFHVRAFPDQQHFAELDGGTRLEIGRATSELQSPLNISYAVFCLKKKKNKNSTDSSVIQKTQEKIKKKKK